MEIKKEKITERAYTKIILLRLKIKKERTRFRLVNRCQNGLLKSDEKKKITHTIEQ
jgi:hypothetical protein